MDDNHDYKHKNNSRKAKNELYDLFLEDKIVHAENMEKLMNQYEALEKENKRLKSIIENYQKVNKHLEKSSNMREEPRDN